MFDDHRRRATGVVILAALVLPAVAAHGDVFAVNTFDDGNDGACDVNGCTLREAMIETSGTPGNDEILLGAGVYQLSLAGTDDGSVVGDLDTSFDVVVIQGLGRGVTIIDGGDLDRVFQVDPLGGGGVLILRDLTVRNGTTTFFPGGGILVGPTGTLILERCEVSGCAAPDDGAGIAVYGEAYLSDSVLSGNVCTAPFGNGGAIFCRAGGGPGLVDAERCLFVGNSGPNGGSGVFADVFANATFTNCTFSGNGPVSTVMENSGTVLLESCTVTGNSQGLAGFTGGLTIAGTLVAGNAQADHVGTTISAGYNLIGNTAFGSLVGDPTGNVLNVNPLLGPLDDNGGSTRTHALLDGSPAIDAGAPAAFPPVDQRGVGRPIDGNGDGSALPDIGAFEAGGQPIVDCNGNGVDDAIDIANGTSVDCDGNGVPDACDLAGGAALDCNGNGIPDSCDLVSGVLTDADGSGVPDECEASGDLDGNGAVDGADLGAVLAVFGEECPKGCPADLNGDGMVDGADLGMLLSGWR